MNAPKASSSLNKSTPVISAHSCVVILDEIRVLTGQTKLGFRLIL